LNILKAVARTGSKSSLKTKALSAFIGAHQQAGFDFQLPIGPTDLSLLAESRVNSVRFQLLREIMKATHEFSGDCGVPLWG
jgi:hypothetical protein